MLKESATGPLAPFAGHWAYPWDIAQWGIKRTVEKVRNPGITDLSVATVYHSGQILSLATGEPRFFTRNDGPLFSFLPGCVARRRVGNPAPTVLPGVVRPAPV